MTAQETAWQAAESAAAALAPDADVFGSVDAAGLGSSTFSVLRRAAAKPTATASAAMRFWTSMAMAGPVAAARWMGMDAPPPVPVPERRQAVRGPGVDRQPGLLRHPAGPPGHVAGWSATCSRRAPGTPWTTPRPRSRPAS